MLDFAQVRQTRDCHNAFSLFGVALGLYVDERHPGLQSAGRLLSVDTRSGTMPILNPLDEDALLRFAAGIVSAYVKNNSVSEDDLPRLIAVVCSALTKLYVPERITAVAPFKPAVSVRKSVTNEYIICLEDGKKFKSLKRHLRAHFGMTPDEYRDKWGLGRDYPMVAPNYARARSDLAKSMGLGQQRRRNA